MRLTAFIAAQAICASTLTLGANTEDSSLEMKEINPFKCANLPHLDAGAQTMECNRLCYKIKDEMDEYERLMRYA